MFTQLILTWTRPTIVYNEPVQKKDKLTLSTYLAFFFVLDIVRPASLVGSGGQKEKHFLHTDMAFIYYHIITSQKHAMK